MINPTLPFDPTSLFTFLELGILGANGVQTVTGDAVPSGINRVIFGGYVTHNDGAASHVIVIKLVNPQVTLAYNMPLTTLSATASGVSNPLTQPFIVPGTWKLQIQSTDAIAGGAALTGRFIYLDYLVRTQ